MRVQLGLMNMRLQPRREVTPTIGTLGESS